MNSHCWEREHALFALRIVQELLRWDWPMNLVNPLMGRFNPFLRENRINPYPQYEKLRDHAPIYWHPVLRMWIVTGYEEITQLLSDDGLSVDRTKSPMVGPLLPTKSLDPGFYAAMTGSLLMTDPPRHTRLRTLVGKAFTPSAVKKIESNVVEIANELLDRLERKSRVGPVDFIREFAYPFPLAVIAEFLGIPPRDHAKLREWSDKLSVLLDLLQYPGGLRRAETAYRSFAVYFREMFESRRRDPIDDFMGHLVNAHDQGDKLSDDELLSLCVLILGAGHETVSKTLGNGVYALSRAPEQRQQFMQHPEITASAVEELMRFDSPVQMYDRVVLEDFSKSFGDGPEINFLKGQLVTMVIGAGNRDPRRFENPNEMILDRTDNRHLSFSWGNHFCLGAALARMELQIGLRSVFERFPNLEVPPVSYANRARTHVLRGFKTLPVRLGESVKQPEGLEVEAGV